MDALEIIDRLPEEFAARLRGDDFFVDVPVVVMEKGNVEKTIRQKQAVLTTKAQKAGVAVIVLQLIGDDERPGLRFGPMTLYPAFQVVELVEKNLGPGGTGKSARKVARRIRDVIKSGPMEGFVLDLKPSKPCIAPVDLASELGREVVGYQVEFQCLEVGDPPTQVKAPVIGQVGESNTVALSCATEGAAIWYTTDDSYPEPTSVNPESTAKLYEGPIEVPADGLLLRACAYVAGMIASEVPRKVITAVEA